MMPSAAELHYFIEVANTLNVSRAAERLGISQPTLSLAIQRLEQSFGVPLLIRTKSGVKLTHAGDKLVGQARNLVLEWEKIRADALKDEAEIRGRYTLGCHPSVGLYSLHGILPTLLEENPGLELKLVHDLSRKITEDVISFKIDFGIVVNPTEHPDLIIKNLCKDEVTLWTSKSPSLLQDLTRDQAVLFCDSELLQTQSILKQLAKQGLHFKRVITSANLEVIASLVAAKAGIGILPGRVAQRVKSYQLIALGKESPKFPDRICLVFRADAQRSKANRLLAKAIETNFNPEPSF